MAEHSLYLHGTQMPLIRALVPRPDTSEDLALNPARGVHVVGPPTRPLKVSLVVALSFTVLCAVLANLGVPYAGLAGVLGVITSGYVAIHQVVAFTTCRTGSSSRSCTPTRPRTTSPRSATPGT